MKMLPKFVLGVWVVGTNGIRDDRADSSIGIGQQYEGYFGLFSLGQYPMFIFPEAFNFTNGFAMVRGMGDKDVNRKAFHAYRD